MEDKPNKALSMIAKGAILFLVGMLISKFLGFIYRVILSRMGEQAYGELSLGIALFSILSTISILGLNTGVLKFISSAKTENNFSKIKGILFSSSKYVFISSIIISIILFISSNWISSTFFHSENLSLILKIFAIALPFESLRSIITNTFKAFQNIKYDVYGRVISENLIKIIFTFIFIYFGLGIIGATIAYVLSIILSFVLMFLLLELKTFSLINKKIEAIYNNKELLLYSLPLVFNSLTLSIMAWADTLMLGFYQTTSTVGIYNVAIPTAKLILIFPTALASLFLPLIASVNNDNKEFKKVYFTTTKWILLINSLALVWMIIYGKELISLFFTATYLPAYIPLIILLIGYFINSAVYTSRDILLFKDKTKLIFNITLASCLINIILNFMLIPNYSMLGAAIASASSLTFMSIMIFIFCKKETSTNPFTPKIFLIVLLSLIAGILTKLMTNFISIDNYKFIIAFSIISITAITFLFFYLTRTIDKEDINITKMLISRIKEKITPDHK